MLESETDSKPRYSKNFIAQRQKVHAKDVEVYNLIKEGIITVDLATGRAWREGKPLSTQLSVYGYSKTFYKRKSYIYTSRLVLIASSGLPECIYLECHHIDHDKANNSVDNLRWTTRSENVTAAFASGAKVINGIAPSLNAEERIQVRELYSSGWTLGQLSRQFDVSILSVKKFLEREPRTSTKAKPYHVKSPTGQIFTGINLRRFCALKGLSYTKFRRARISGKPFMGWRHLPIAECEGTLRG